MTAGMEPPASEDVVVVVEIDLGEVGFPIVVATEVGFDAPDGDNTVVARTEDPGCPGLSETPTVVTTAAPAAPGPRDGCTSAVGG